MRIKSEFTQLLARKDLLYILVTKKLKEKHVGSLLGYFWSFYTALFPVFSYVFVFFFIAKISVEGAEGPWGYVVFVFSGLLPWLFFNKIVIESTDALNNSIDILKQAIFPVEIISVVIATENLVNMLLQSALLVLICGVMNPAVLLKAPLLVVYFVFLYMFCLGLSWMLSIVGFYLRDLKDIFTSSLQFLIYITPVLYKKENIPDKLWILFILNPMTHAINAFRDILYNPVVQNPESAIVFAAVSIITFIAGYYAIFSVKTAIGDMI